MWASMLVKAVTGLVRQGDLTITLPDGRARRFGDGGGDAVAIRLTDPALPRKLMRNPELALGEAYMDGTLLLEAGDLRALLTLLARNSRAYGSGRFKAAAAGARTALRRIAQHNPLGTARKNVEHHYDLSVELYELFLDPALQYSCAYYPEPGMGLEDAQRAKMAHIAGKLLLEPGMRVLDIGSGWGGLSVALACDHGVQVTGVTLSRVQLDHARKRAAAAGVADRVDFRLTDYRDLAETFDRIVVVGMLEHVGQPQYATFFDRLQANLAPDGVALVHTIGRATRPGSTSPFIHKYIFPGGYVPALSEVAREVEKTGLTLTDLEVWRTHYIQTLRHWQERFEANLDRIAAMYDDRFCRMWRYYLVASEVGFAELGVEIFQLQFARNPRIVPDSRDYLYRG